METEQYVGCVMGPRNVPVPITAGQRIWDTGHESAAPCCLWFLSLLSRGADRPGCLPEWMILLCSFLPGSLHRMKAKLLRNCLEALAFPKLTGGGFESTGSRLIS